MTELNFHQLLEYNKPILFDGAMGTMLNLKGIAYDQCFDELNLTHPALVAEVHREYIEAGAQVIQTNTFGANRFKLNRHSLSSKIREINSAAVELAKRVVLSTFKQVLIAGDIGPLGVRLAPFGRVHPEEAYAAFHEQMGLLSTAGVDLIIIETMTDLHEIEQAIRAARDIDPGLPVIASMTFTRDDRTILGDDPLCVVKNILSFGADVVGINCSGGPTQLVRILKIMHHHFPDAMYSVMPNAGWPQQTAGRIMYPAAPDYFGEYAQMFWQSGANIMGGCCGTTPQHILAMRKAIDQFADKPIIEIQQQLPAEANEVAVDEGPTLFSKNLSSGKFAIAVEMDPPRGLSAHKLIAGATLLSESGADVINVSDSPMARMRMSPWAVCHLIQDTVGIETVLHFPTRGRNLLRVQGDLLAAHAMRVRNVFVVMGDPTAIGDYPTAMDDYDLVPSGLINLIKKHFNTGVDQAGADIGQPTVFFVGCALNLNPTNMEQEAKRLWRKVQAGADYILTQPVYESALVGRFLTYYEKTFEKLDIPLLLGILPLVNVRHAAFLQHEVPGIEIPLDIMKLMNEAGESGYQTGIEIAIQLIGQVKKEIQGVFIVPAFNRFNDVAEIIEAIRS